MKGANWTIAAAVGLGLIALAAADSSAEAEPAEPKPRKRRSPPSTPEPPAPKEEEKGIQPGGDESINQFQIAEALWDAVGNGNSSQLETIKSALSKMTPELQVYIIAASQVARQSYAEFLKDRIAFEHQFDKENAQYDESMRNLDIVFGTTAAAVNVVPVIGQALSGIIAIGLAVKKAVQAALGHPERKYEDNIDLFKDWEGSTCIRGLHIEGDINHITIAGLKSRIDGDLIASRLPSAQFGNKFSFTPTVEDYRAVARKMGLYSAAYLSQAYGFKAVWNIKDGEDVPTVAYEIEQYIMGLDYGESATPPDNQDPWFKIGIQDALAGRETRVSGEVQVWAQKFLGNL